MPLSDKKKVQTAINVAGQQCLKMRAAMEIVKDIRTKFNAANPNTTNTPLEGNEAAMSQAITDLDIELNKPIWDALIAGIKPSHRNKAL